MRCVGRTEPAGRNGWSSPFWRYAVSDPGGFAPGGADTGRAGTGSANSGASGASGLVRKAARCPARARRGRLAGAVLLSAAAVMAPPQTRVRAEPSGEGSCFLSSGRPVAVQPGTEPGIFKDKTGGRYFAAGIWPFDATLPQAGEGGAFEAIALDEANRWGVRPAWILQSDAEEGLSLYQDALLTQGVALFQPSGATFACSDRLRRAEGEAIGAKAGHWGHHSGFKVYSTAAPKALEGKAGTYVVARGRIVSLGKTARTRYLNFGRHWKTDFTGTLSVSAEDRFNAVLSRSGRSLEGLSGAVVEIRGILEERDGPLIALKDPGQLVVLKGRRSGRGGEDSK